MLAALPDEAGLGAPLLRLSSGQALPRRIDRIDGALTAIVVDDEQVESVELALTPTEERVELIPGDPRLLAQVLEAAERDGEFRCDVALYLPRDWVGRVSPVQAPMVFKFELLDEQGNPLVTDRAEPRMWYSWRERVEIKDHIYVRVVPRWSW